MKAVGMPGNCGVKIECVSTDVVRVTFDGKDKVQQHDYFIAEYPELKVLCQHVESKDDDAVTRGIVIGLLKKLEEKGVIKGKRFEGENLVGKTLLLAFVFVALLFARASAETKHEDVQIKTTCHVTARGYKMRLEVCDNGTTIEKNDDVETYSGTERGTVVHRGNLHHQDTYVGTLHIVGDYTTSNVRQQGTTVSLHSFGIVEGETFSDTSTGVTQVYLIEHGTREDSSSDSPASKDDASKDNSDGGDAKGAFVAVLIIVGVCGWIRQGYMRAGK